MSTDVRRLVLVTCALTGALSFLGPATLSARQPIQPAVSVVAFDGPGIARGDREAMADELASRLVESGRFRVMPREWLPADRENDDPSMSALFDSAKSVCVEYLIFGTVHQSMVAIAPPQRSAILAASGMRLLAPSHGVFMPAPRLVPSQKIVFSVSVRIVDVATSDVVRTASAGRTATVRAAQALPVPAGALQARPYQDWRKVIADIAGRIDLRAPARLP